MKKMNIAFIWHFHQPSYQENQNSDFLLPWVRLHASKDYLDMLKHIDNFDNLKLNFNFSPILLESLQKYKQGAMDVHLRLLLKENGELTQDDKIFILNNYFDLNYKNMVLKKPYFTELYNRRANTDEPSLEMFDIQEYFDIMANYTLCWIDEYFKKDYPELEKLNQKEKNYSFQERKKIYEIQLDIINRILIEYKDYQDKNKIEVSISPYYHPILPLLIDFKNKEIKDITHLPQNFSHIEWAKEQIKKSIDKYVEIFEKKPKGMWLSEQCVCLKSEQMLSKEGIKWNVLDEGILSKTLKKEFIRDFEGNLENPFELNILYQTACKNPINILFANSFFSNLINFSYGNYDYKSAAIDMYERIKIIQSKLQNSPKENHILTIALDGENCWESYIDDGTNFLNELYSLICSDNSLNTVCINEFIEKNEKESLENLKSGSWINRNFDLWIGEATKNTAWLYLSSVIEDFKQFQKENSSKENKLLTEKIKQAQEELLNAQGSDWYWWYGEPNESKNDDIFDFLFRSHLMNVYKILELPIPEYLTLPLADTTVKTLKNPAAKISPELNCQIVDKAWDNAGSIFVPDKPTSNVSSLIKYIYFGCDNENIYFRFELNKDSLKIKYENIVNQIAIYFTDNFGEYQSPIAFASKNEQFYPVLRNHFEKEVRFAFNKDSIFGIFAGKAAPWGLWSKIISKNLKANFENNIIEMKLSKSDLKINKDNVLFLIMDTSNGFINEIYPQDSLINLKLN